MKIIITAVLALTFTLSSVAQVDRAQSQRNVLLEFLANDLGFKDVALYTIIAKRCSLYLPAADVKKCQDSVDQMVMTLNSDILFPPSHDFIDDYQPKAFLFVAFKKNLISLLSSSQTTDYLNDLQRELNDYLLGHNPDLNIWDFTLRYYQNDLLMAAKVISALYQDTTRARLHLNFLEKAKIRGNEHFKHNKELLERFLESLSMIMEMRTDDLHTLLYPKNTKRTLNKNLYHYYVPFYLSLALKEKKIDSYMSFVAPMLMTLTYEFITSANDYRYIFADPAHLSDQDYKIRDIFAGYQGASAGSARKISQDYKSLQKGLGTSVPKTVKAMLAR